MTINSLVTGSNLTKDGTGTVLLTNPSNSYGTATYISGGYDGSGNPIFGDLEVPSDPNFDTATEHYLGALPATVTANDIVLTSGILQFATTATPVAVTLSTNRSIGLNGLGGGIDTGNNIVSYSSVISNFSSNSASIGSFTKLGSGTLILSGSSTYPGYTAVSAARWSSTTRPSAPANPV